MNTGTRDSAAAAAAVLKSLGLLTPAALDILANWQAQTGRGERTVLNLPCGGHALLIDHSYNANPASMRAALMEGGALVKSLRARKPVTEAPVQDDAVPPASDVP